MDFRIITNMAFDLHGFSAANTGGNSTEIAFRLMDRMWQIVKSNHLENKGLNVWVYGPGDMIFAGVELIDHPDNALGLEQKTIQLQKSAFSKHIGPYHLIPSTAELMRAELKKRGLPPGALYIEVYGHWTKDEAALQTDLYLALK
jgi:hypothetical protein